MSVIEYLKQHPEASTEEVVQTMNCRKQQVYSARCALRKQGVHFPNLKAGRNAKPRARKKAIEVARQLDSQRDKIRDQARQQKDDAILEYSHGSQFPTASEKAELLISDVTLLQKIGLDRVKQIVTLLEENTG